MVRARAVEELKDDLKRSGRFKHIYTNIVPVWTAVSRMPAVAILYEQEHSSRHNQTNSSMMYEGTILVYIYNSQSSNEYEDILSDLIEEVRTIILENEYLRCNTIDTIITSMKRDGGTIHPHAMAQLMVSVKFKSRA